MTIYKFHLKKSPFPGADCCVVHTTNFSIKNIAFCNASQSNLSSNVCYSNLSSNVCYSNLLGNVCYSNLSSNVCYSNLSSNVCYSNLSSNVCHSNLSSNVCHSDVSDTLSVSSYSWGSGFDTQDGVFISGSGSLNEAVVEHTIEGVETLFSELVEVIVTNELNNYTVPTDLSETYLTQELYKDLTDFELSGDTNSISSGDLGFVGMGSSDNGSNWPFEEFERQMHDIISTIQLGNKYLKDYGGV